MHICTQIERERERERPIIPRPTHTTNHNPQPTTHSPQPTTRNPKPKIHNPQPKTQDPKFKTHVTPQTTTATNLTQWVPLLMCRDD